MLMGMVFTVYNALIQGSIFIWRRQTGILNLATDIRFILGTLIFLTGMVINLHSDKIIRGLREKGDTKHYCRKEVCSTTLRVPIILGKFWNGWVCHTYLVVQ